MVDIKDTEQLGLLYAVIRDAASANARSDFDASAQHLQCALDAVSALLKQDETTAQRCLEHVQRSGLEQAAAVKRIQTAKESHADRLQSLKVSGIDFSQHFLSLSVFRRSA